MANKKRDIGREILDGLRELKQGRSGRIINVCGRPPRSGEIGHELGRRGWPGYRSEPDATMESKRAQVAA
jgi:hypothetical protein